MSDTRLHIISSARKLMSMRGYADVSMADIAKDVGIAKSSIYHFFKDKASLYAEVLIEYIHHAQSIYTYADGEVPSRKILEQKLLAGITYGIDHGNLLASFEHIASVPKYQKDIMQAFHNLYGSIEETLTQSGVLDPSFGVHMILDMGYSYVKKHHHKHTHWTPQEFIRHLSMHLYGSS